ncbi:MucBP domain-containing protein [Streptococcus suis]|uniref:mucin-binding protein n=1 Tax=Streptococcus suis TaxID=1307 RepID=UPI0038BA1EF9
MRKNNKKSFNWYGMRQHFSIRKYHFGAASVLLGMSLALGAGGQAVKAEETVASSEALASTTATSSTQASSEVVPATSVETVATETVASTTPAATTTEVAATERTATINYIVQYLLEDGTLVEAVVKSATVTTTDATAKTTVDVTAELPEGYVLAEGQKETTSNQVTEGAENLVTIKVVKKAEVAATTTEAPAAATTATETAAPAATTAATAEEAKVVLEQNISEAVVLSDEASRIYAAAPEGNESLKTAADATKLAATEATAVLNDSVATLEQVNTQIDAVRTNVEALALELRKRDEDGVLTVALAAPAVAGSTLGSGAGTLVEAPSVSPSIDDPNGASIDSAAVSGLIATQVSDYLTVSYSKLADWYDSVIPSWYKGQSTNGAYFRTSISKDSSQTALLVELVNKDGQVLETQNVNLGDTVDFTSFTNTNDKQAPLVVSYTNTTDSDTVAGELRISFDNNTISTTALIPKLIDVATYYKVVNADGTIGELANYKITTLPSISTTPSNQRDFPGYSYTNTTTETTNSTVAGAPYVETSRDIIDVVGLKTVVTPTGTDGSVNKTIYIVDPTYQGDRSFTDLSQTGFVKLGVSGGILPNGTNTSYTLDPTLVDNYTVMRMPQGWTYTDGFNNPESYVTTVNDLTLSGTQSLVIDLNPTVDVTVPTAWPLLKYLVVWLPATGNYTGIRTMFVRTPWLGEKTDNPDQKLLYKGINQPIGLRNNVNTSVTETTYWYTAIPQIAQIIYQTEDGTQLDNIDSVTGNPGDTINYSTANRINAYKLAGYELVSDGGPQSGQDATYDYTNDDATDPSQKFYVILKERIVDVPKDVVPGQPVDPTDPNSPVWPAGVDNLTLTEEVTRTITYVDEAGNEVATTFTDKVSFTRTAQVNLVTGEITYSDWTADNADNVLDGNKLPEVPGYTATTATKDGAAVTPGSTTEYAQVTADSADIVEKVVYVQDTQTAKITISTVDANGANKSEYASVTETGKATEPIATQTVEEKLLELKRKGYDVETKVTDTFLDSAKTFDNVKDTADQPSQSYEIVVKPRIVDIPKDVVPGQPVDPTDPNSPVWPDSVGNLTLTEEVTRTITYVNEAGEEVAATFTDKVSFTRTAQVNLVTGEITYSDWTADNADSVLDGNKLPEVPGYTATTATKDGKDVTPDSTTKYAQVAADSADIVEKVVYVQDTQTAKITISTVDANGQNKTEFATVTETGKATESIATQTVEEKLLELKRKGYDVETKVTDTFLDSAKTFDNVKDTADQPSQSYEIVVKPRIVDIPKDVVPGQPVDPTDPNSPVWPADVDNLTLTEEVTRTITYVDEAGKEVATTFTDKVTFTRTAQVNLVTGEITYSDWTADNGDNVLAGNPLPTVKDHQVSTATKDGVAVLPASTTSEVPVAADSADIVEKVVYAKDKGSVTIQYKDTDGNVIKAPVVDEDNVVVGTQYDTTDEGDKPTVINNADKTKYVLVPSLTEGAETGTVVKDGTTVTYVYQKVANWIPVIPGRPENERPVFPYPFDPENPDQPLTPTPGTVIPYVPGYVPVGPDGKTPLEPVNPEDPSKGYVPPTPSKPGDNTYIPYVKVEKGSVLVAFVDEAGSPIKSVVTDTDNAEVGTSYDTTDQKEDVIKANGFTYYFKEVKAGSAETGKVVEGVTTVTYVYTKVANWIPVIPGIPENERPVFPYPFDPTNPDKPIDPTTPGTVIPYEPGYVPVGPDGTTPLKPVDPNDPTKGYEPPTPSTPGDNTYIPYVKAGSVVVKYQDTNGKELLAPVVDENNVKVGTAYDTTDQKKSEITDAEGNRYVLVPSKTVGSETGKVTDGTTEVIYVYQKVANWVPQIPATPENPTPVNPVIPYPFDPTNPDKPIDPTTPGTNGEVPSIPHVPGYVPVDPKTNEPLKPVDPTDPSKGYVPPTPDETGKDTPIPYVKTGSVVVKYKDTDGRELLAPVVDENNVKVGTAYDTTDQKKPEITDAEGNRYVLVPSKTVGSETGEVTDGTTEVIYVYQKVANWIPQIPATPENPTPVNPVIPYPFDPTNPDKPIDPTTPYPGGGVPSIPHVPGYVPVDPKTNEPLKPVDPTDPSKGYVPPTPDKPGVDTPIPYVPATPTKKVVTNYVDEETGLPIAPQEEGTTPNKSIPGYEYVRTVVDADGNTTHIYRKKPTTPVTPVVPGEPVTPPVTPVIPGEPVTPPVTPVVPGEPVTPPVAPVVPGEPVTPPVATVVPGEPVTPPVAPVVPGEPVAPATPVAPVTPAKPAAPATSANSGAAQLPNTGESSTAAASALGVGMLIAALALAGKRRRNED